MVVYNFFCSMMSFYSLLYIAKALTADGVSVFDMSDNLQVKQGFYVYLITKYLELLDTIFMMLRHKQRQISFLHVSFDEFIIDISTDKIRMLLKINSKTVTVHQQDAIGFGSIKTDTGSDWPFQNCTGNWGEFQFLTNR